MWPVVTHNLVKKEPRQREGLVPELQSLMEQYASYLLDSSPNGMTAEEQMELFG